MNINKNRQEVSLNINWGVEYTKQLLLQALLILPITFILIALFINASFIFSKVGLLVAFAFYLITFLILFISKGTSKLICTAEELIIENPNNTIIFQTNQVAQFYLKYINSSSGINILFITKGDREIDCFNGNHLNAKKARLIEETLERFLGIEDYYVDGEYQVEGHQKTEVHQRSYIDDSSQNIIFSHRYIEGTIEKEFQFEWNNNITCQVLWVHTGQKLEIVYKDTYEIILEKKINKTIFFNKVLQSSPTTLSDIPHTFNYNNKLYYLIEELNGQFFPKHTEKERIAVNQKLYKNNNSCIRICSYSNLNIEISEGKSYKV